MLRFSRILMVAILAILAAPAEAQQGNYSPYFQKDGGAQVPAYLMMCAESQTSRSAVPCGTMAAPFASISMPFTRLHSAPIQLTEIGTTPKSFPINRPANATTYRIVNPCEVDIRLLGTMDAAAQVSATTGVLYLARTEATMGTSKPIFISAMTMAPPPAPCTPEMHYGIGGG